MPRATKITDADVAWQSVPNAIDHVKWYKNKGMLKLLFYISIIYTGQILNGFDGTVTGNMLALTAWNRDLGYPDATKIGLLNGVQYIAGIIFGPIGGWAADKWGRKIVLRYATAMLIATIFGVIAGSVEGNTGYALFVTGRVFVGAGLAPGLMIMQAQIHEIAHPRHRSVTAALFNSNWTLGSVVCSFVVFGCSFGGDATWTWRVPYTLHIPLAVYMLVAIQFMPESPRWLIANGRVEEAKQFFIETHGNGDVNDALVHWEIEEAVGAIAAEREAKAEKWSIILKDPIERKRMWIAGMLTFCTQMSGSAIVEYYYSVILGLVGITAQSTVVGIGVALSMWGYICQLIGSWSTKKIRRRQQVLSTWVFLFAFMLAIFGSSYAFGASGEANLSAGIATVVFVWLLNGGANFAAPVFYSMPAEILSFSTRAKGMSVWNTVINQATGVYGSFVNSIGLDAIGSYYYLVYVGLLALEFVMMYIWMVETKGLTLEEIDMAFRGADSAVAKIDASLEAGIAERVVVDGGDAESEKKGAGSM